MGELAKKTCTPCRGGIPPLDAAAASRLLAEAPGWTLDEAGTRLRRRWTFRNYAEALAFVTRVSELVEAEGHHPDVHFGWGYCELVFYTHKIGGLHENDFIIAAKVGELATG